MIALAITRLQKKAGVKSVIEVRFSIEVLFGGKDLSIEAPPVFCIQKRYAAL